MPTLLLLLLLLPLLLQVSIKKVYTAADVTFNMEEVVVDTNNPEPVTVRVRCVITHAAFTHQRVPKAFCQQVPHMPCWELPHSSPPYGQLS
jgi:hypothetical protein